MSYITDAIKGKNKSFIAGFKLGIMAFAYWKDGKQCVGCGKKLSEVLKEIQEYQRKEK